MLPDECPGVAVLSDGTVPCILPRGHAGQHSYGDTLTPFDCDDESPGL